jgi:hypothetical protein
VRLFQLSSVSVSVSTRTSFTHLLAHCQISGRPAASTSILRQQSLISITACRAMQSIQLCSHNSCAVNIAMQSLMLCSHCRKEHVLHFLFSTDLDLTDHPSWFQVVMAIRCRGNNLFDGLYTGVNIKQIALASKMVSLLSFGACSAFRLWGCHSCLRRSLKFQHLGPWGINQTTKMLGRRSQ